MGNCDSVNECAELRERVKDSSERIDFLSNQLQNASKERERLEEKFENILSKMREAHENDIGRWQAELNIVREEKKKKDVDFANLQKMYFEMQIRHQETMIQAQREFDKILEKERAENREQLAEQARLFKGMIEQIMVDNNKRVDKMMKQNEEQAKMFTETIRRMIEMNEKTQENSNKLVNRMLDRLDAMDKRDAERLTGKQLYHMVMQQKDKLERKHSFEPVKLQKLTPVVAAAYSVLDAIAGGTHASIA